MKDKIRLTKSLSIIWVFNIFIVIIKYMKIVKIQDIFSIRFDIFFFAHFYRTDFFKPLIMETGTLLLLPLICPFFKNVYS